MRPFLVCLLAVGWWTLQNAPSQNEVVSIRVDGGDVVGPMTPIWAWFGYDEPNYTYMKDRTKLLSALADLNPGPVYVRAHNS